MRTLYLVYLDREHLGDKLYMQGLAQKISASPSGEPPCILVHGSGEKVERTLEAEGYFPERSRGVLEVDSAEHIALVERAVREVNQEIVSTLTDEVVSTVGVQGDKRSLMTRRADGIGVGKVGWVEALVKQRILPVVSALAEDASDGRVREIWTADALVALFERGRVAVRPRLRARRRPARRRRRSPRASHDPAGLLFGRRVLRNAD